MTLRDLNIDYFPKQKLFLSCPADEILFGGARGGSKSFCATQKALHLAITWPGIRIGLFRRSLPELRMTLLWEAQQKYPDSIYKYKDQLRCMDFLNGSQILFNYVETDKDLLNYKGVGFDVIIIDEAIDFTEYQIVYLKGSLRSSIGRGFRPRLFLMTNPIGVSHAYLKQRYVDNMEPYKVYPTPETQHLPKEMQTTRCFIPSRLIDNPALMDNDPGYLYRLSELPENERMALLFGLWDTNSGVFFSEWNKDIHIESENYSPKSTDNIILSGDWGSAKPSWFGFVAIDYQGTEHLFDEFYTMKGNQHDVGTNQSAYQVAGALVAKIKELDIDVRQFILDSQCWAKDGTSAESIAEIFMRELHGLRINLSQAKKDRINGWQVVRKHMRINPQTGKPYVRVSPRCQNFLRTFPVLIHDPKRDGDLNSEMEDHAADGFRYYCMSRPVPRTIDEDSNSEYGTMTWYLNQDKLNKECKGICQ